MPGKDAEKAQVRLYVGLAGTALWVKREILRGLDGGGGLDRGSGEKRTGSITSGPEKRALSHKNKRMPR